MTSVKFLNSSIKITVGLNNWDKVCAPQGLKLLEAILEFFLPRFIPVLEFALKN